MAVPVGAISAASLQKVGGRTSDQPFLVIFAAKRAAGNSEVCVRNERGSGVVVELEGTAAQALFTGNELGGSMDDGPCTRPLFGAFGILPKRSFDFKLSSLSSTFTQGHP
jgi:hypothetical protein